MTLFERFPFIPWTEPQYVTINGKGAGFNCRICVANHGFRAVDGPHFATLEEGRAHIAESHPEYLE